jgi:hypothetical protein
MPAWLWIVIVVAAVLVVAALAAAWFARRRRTQSLRTRFGDEYDVRVRDEGNRRRAETRLVDVTDKRDRLTIHPLNATARARYLDRWRELQSRFLDQPGHALDAADVLVGEVLRERGYPGGEYEEQVDLVAIDHPQVVRHYRSAHETLDRTRAGLAGTEEVRVAMIQYRSLFETLLAEADPDERPSSSANGVARSEPSQL